METSVSEHKDVQLVTAVAKLLSRHPEDVSVNRTIDELGVLITLQVHPEDMASIIGREGRAAKALRTLLRVVGAQNNERVNMKIAEPMGAEPRESTPRHEEAPAEEYHYDAPQSQPEPVAPAPTPQPTPSDSSSFMNLDDIPEPLA